MQGALLVATLHAESTTAHRSEQSARNRHTEASSEVTRGALLKQC
jgi:hypothetical protein